MDEISQLQLRFIANEKIITALQADMVKLQQAISTLQGQIGSFNSRLNEYKQNVDERLKKLEQSKVTFVNPLPSPTPPIFMPSTTKSKWKFW